MPVAGLGILRKTLEALGLMSLGEDVNVPLYALLVASPWHPAFSQVVGDSVLLMLLLRWIHF